MLWKQWAGAKKDKKVNEKYQREFSRLLLLSLSVNGPWRDNYLMIILLKILNVKKDHNAYHDEDNDERVNSDCQSESYISAQLRLRQSLSFWLTYRRNKIAM